MLIKDMELQESNLLTLHEAEVGSSWSRLVGKAQKKRRQASAVHQPTLAAASHSLQGWATCRKGSR